MPPLSAKQARSSEYWGAALSRRSRAGTGSIALPSKRGHSRAYALYRLSRERPDLLKKVKAGKLSAHAAAIEAGFRKSLSPFDRILKFLPKLTPDQRRQIHKATAP